VEDSGEILARPLDIYGRFSESEVALMQAFSANVRELTTYSFFKLVPTELTLTAARGGPVDTRMRDPPSEATRAAAALFRQVYWHREPANFDKTMKLLKANVHMRDGSARREALAALSDVHVGQKEILDYGVGIGFYFGDGNVSTRLTTETILATYLNGVWLHGSNDKSKRARALDQAPPVARFTFYGAIYQLTKLYAIGANIVDLALAEPGLTEQS
jgi:hypothetical protein